MEVGAVAQTAFSKAYGEDKTGAYSVVGISGSKTFYLGGNRLSVKAGVQNIFDTYYSTYSDWNNIPRRGRNVFLNLSYVLK